jgi:uncharacterized protein (DUF342 family)
MTVANVQISYNQSLYRVTATFTPALCMQNKKPDKDLFKRAKEKFEIEKSKGLIESYQVYEEEFNRIWFDIRSKEITDPERPLKFTLGQGSRLIPGLYVFPSTSKNTFEITIKTPIDRLRKENWNTFYYNITRLIEAENLDIKPHEAMLKSVFMRAKMGLAIRQWQVQSQPSMETKNDRGISFSINKQKREAYATIYDETIFKDHTHIEGIIRRCKKAYQMTSKKYPDVVFLESTIKKDLELLQTSVSVLGVQLPRTILVAYAPSSSPVQKLSPLTTNSLAQKAGSKTKETAKDEVAIKISPDGMSAAFVHTSAKALEHHLGHLSADKLTSEILKRGIKYGYQDFVDKIIQLASGGQSLHGVAIAQGLQPEPGEEIYLHPTFAEAPKIDPTEFKIDMRAAQNRKVVKKGEQIAELRYKDGKVGKNVFGEDVFMIAENPPDTLVVGENVTPDGKGRFMSAIDGIPTVEATSISCSTVYVHEGDVNLTSGDINYDGSVQITGNVDGGASVIVSGDLIVEGMILPSFIKCGGNLTVAGGIVTSGHGWIEVEKNLEADFVENSKVSVHGSMTVKNSVFNSDVVVGSNLIVMDKANGRVAGGHISVKNVIRTGHFGFPEGLKTVCRMGGDWKLERRKTILEGRKERLNKILNIETKNANELRQLRRRTKMQEDMLKKKDEKIKHINKLHTAIDKKIAQSDKESEWNENARIDIEGVIYNNCRISMGTKKVKVTSDMRSVFVSYKAIKGSRILPYEQLKDFLNIQPTDESP